jgi:hypothetical protein
MSNFIGGQTAKPEGSALNVVQNCLTNLQHYRVESADIQSQEQLKIVLHLGHHLLMEELSVIPIDDIGDLNDRKDLIIEALTAICNSDFSAPKARFLLALRSCINYGIKKNSIADILFLFVMSLSLNEQMTQTS